MDEDNKDKKSDNFKRFKAYAFYSSMVLQMGVAIGFCAWFGHWLDGKYNNETPIWTLVFSLFSIAAELYLVITSILRRQ